jgi:signal transduction histidine kinase
MAFLRVLAKPWLTAGITAVVWLAVSLGWSWFLIGSAFDRTFNSLLTDDARQIGSDLRDKVPARGDADEAMHQAIRRQRVINPNIAYLMIWHSGIVDYHSDPNQERGALNVETWPSFEPGETVHISRLHAVPWDVSAKPTAVVDVTIQIDPTRVYYLSVGYTQDWVDKQFWATQRPQILFAVSFSLVGLAALLAAIAIATQRFERTRTQQEQSVLARTSLLTERGMLASVLAHEVRSPLTALRFNLHSLRNLIASGSPNTPRKVELTDSCDREIRRLDLMLNDFLTRTQVISPAENTSVNRVANEAIEFLRPSLEQKNIRIITHFDQSDPSVIINPAELRQVLLNLCTNAQEAMRRGGTLAVSTLSEQDDVSLLVRDSGVGIPPEMQERIFEPFFSTKPQGSGLGLALVRRVISGAGGKVFCESTAGEGTTFRVVLPRGQGSTPAAPTMHIAPEGVDADGGESHSVDMAENAGEMTNDE